MCLVAISYEKSEKYRLVVASNRDEFYRRESEAADWWEGEEILGGRDLEAGGTWLGVTRQRRFGVLTNYRDPAHLRKEAKTRGKIVTNFLKWQGKTEEYLEKLLEEGERYNGFNLIVFDGQQLFYANNLEKKYEVLRRGLYGLSNHFLETPWPKVKRIKRYLSESLNKNLEEKQFVREVFTFLQDRWRPSDEELPSTGVGLEWERLLSSIFIEGEDYGTRCSTLLTIDYDDNVSFYEKGYHPNFYREFHFSLKQDR